MATNKRRDFTQVAFDVVQRATGETLAPAPTERQESGRKGGLKGGMARSTKMTPQRRREIAIKAAAARWTDAGGIKQPDAESDPVESDLK